MYYAVIQWSQLKNHSNVELLNVQLLKLCNLVCKFSVIDYNVKKNNSVIKS